jgi:hypothetical protein
MGSVPTFVRREVRSAQDSRTFEEDAGIKFLDIS